MRKLLKNNRIILMLVVFFITVLVAGCGDNQSANDTEGNSGSAENTEGNNYNITIAGASPQGFFSVMTEGYANILREELPSIQVGVEPGDIATGISKLEQGERDISWAQITEAVAAYEGMKPFSSSVDLNALFTAWADNPFQYVIDKSFAEEHDIETLQDIVEVQPPIRMGVNKKGVLTEAAFNDLINELGFSYEDVDSWGGSVFHTNVSSSTEEMQDGKLDFFAMPVFAPDANIVALSNHADLKVIGIGNDKAMKKVGDKWHLNKTTIEPGTYEFHEEEVETLAISGVALVRPDTSEELAYNLTKTFFEQFDSYTELHQSLSNLSPERAVQTPVPLHPGAKRYLEEEGLLQE